MRIIEVPLERLLDIVTSLQFDGLDQVHDFLGELVETLPDHELRQYIESLKADGYDHNERDEADQHLRRWRARYVKAAPKRSIPAATVTTTAPEPDAEPMFHEPCSVPGCDHEVYDGEGYET